MKTKVRSGVGSHVCQARFPLQRGIADHSGPALVLANLVKITLWNNRNTPGTATQAGEEEKKEPFRRIPQFWLTRGRGGGGG